MQKPTYIVRRYSVTRKKYIPMTLLLLQKSCCTDSFITKCGYEKVSPLDCLVPLCY